MKTKIIFCLALVLTYCVLAYIFMWPPVVREYHARATRSNNPCVNNLRQIDAAVNQWALENGKHTGDPVAFNQIKPYIKLDQHGEIPPCPDGGKYSITLIGVPPTCSLGTNMTTRIRWNYFFWEQNPSRLHRLP